MRSLGRRFMHPFSDQSERDITVYLNSARPWGRDDASPSDNKKRVRFVPSGQGF